MTQEELQKLLDEFGQSKIAQTPQWKIDHGDRFRSITSEQKSKGSKKVGLQNVKNNHIQTLSKRFPPNMSNTWVSVLQYDKNGNFIKEHKSTIEAGNSVNKNSSNIIAVCKGRQKTCAGFIWKYKE